MPFSFSHSLIAATQKWHQETKSTRPRTDWTLAGRGKASEKLYFFSAIFLRLPASFEKYTSPTLKHQIFPVHRTCIKEFILNMRILHSSTICVCCYCVTPEQLKQSVKIMKSCKRPKAKKPPKTWHTSLWMSDCTTLMLCHALELALLLCTVFTLHCFHCKSSRSVVVCTHYVASTALILWQLPFKAKYEFEEFVTFSNDGLQT